MVKIAVCNKCCLISDDTITSVYLFIQEVDLNGALAATVSVAKGLINDKPLDLILDIEPQLPVIFGDRPRIHQIFLNLVSNRIKFTPHGSLTINFLSAQHFYTQLQRLKPQIGDERISRCTQRRITRQTYQRGLTIQRFQVVNGQRD